ncbi:hypothetical protein CAOG_02887 [Capsaspora owczarzaki ATCC 30864]|uniref:Uncharacterized protein n=1 Tax=Capsaspora owczarzaki (strain ATCC 30864) TaxID=595528 RepID=A0A0D2WN80_CAPO3|nr:hypothetical protein CAOG_02887 [Capsaspora owczarzaki ATCC 30864]KJE91803.1 hypothetical protein CAOG_002887 [Capsaspora owczarzaki ATCC 30864]|eukprot:XP_004363726.1 hypothetical protein CAOG_02887 [Capsaspora owczarzaki ATCC 30864]
MSLFGRRVPAVRPLESCYTGSDMIPFKVSSFNGGQFSSEHGPANTLQADTSCFSSASRDNVGVLYELGASVAFVSAANSNATQPLSAASSQAHYREMNRVHAARPRRLRFSTNRHLPVADLTSSVADLTSSVADLTPSVADLTPSSMPLRRRFTREFYDFGTSSAADAVVNPTSTLQSQPRYAPDYSGVGTYNWESTTAVRSREPYVPECHADCDPPRADCDPPRADCDTPPAGLTPEDLDLASTEFEAMTSPYPCASPIFDEIMAHRRILRRDAAMPNLSTLWQNFSLVRPALGPTKPPPRENKLLKRFLRPSCFLSEIIIKAPDSGYTSPVREGVIFLSYDAPPRPCVVASYRDISESDFLRRRLSSLSAPHERPDAFFKVDEKTNVATVTLPVARTVRYVYILFLRSHSSADNIDVQFVGFRGLTRPTSTASGNLN